jgi:hypothetical protein
MAVVKLATSGSQPAGVRGGFQDSGSRAGSTVPALAQSSLSPLHLLAETPSSQVGPVGWTC